MQFRQLFRLVFELQCSFDMEDVVDKTFYCITSKLKCFKAVEMASEVLK